LKGLHSPFAFEMEIELAHIHKKLNATTMDFPKMTKDNIF
jgi:hypothetical protein